MKIITFIILLLGSIQLPAQSAFRCSCELHDRSLCASLYDIDHPCGVLCPGSSPASPPAGKIACPTSRIYNMDKGIYEWRVFCPD